MKKMTFTWKGEQDIPTKSDTGSAELTYTLNRYQVPARFSF